MPYALRQEHALDADVLDPRWWNLNQGELVGIFNGGLDRDNLPAGAIAEGMFVLETLLDCDGSVLPLGTNWVPTMDIIEWQDFNPTTNLGGAITVVAPVDCHLEIDWSGTWEWGGVAWSNAAFGATYAADAVTIRVMVNGVVACESGPREDMADRDSCHIIGDVPLGPGSYTVQVQARVGRMTYRGLDVTAICTNTCTFKDASLVVLERRR
jgi:hypothetical protein